MPTFHEVQKFDMLWFRLIAAFTALSGWGVFAAWAKGIPLDGEQVPAALAFGLLLLLGIGLPWLLLSLKLETTVEGGKVVARYFPLRTRQIFCADIAECKLLEFRPIKDMGGWGIRYAPDFGWAYTVKGNQGVQLTFANGDKLVIGSQRAQELCKAIERESKRGSRR